jgi:hypothetical protein
MSRFLGICLLAGCGIVSVLAASDSPPRTSMAGDRANASEATIEGLVRTLPVLFRTWTELRLT